jgi:hypothetical protein
MQQHTACKSAGHAGSRKHASESLQVQSPGRRTRLEAWRGSARNSKRAWVCDVGRWKGCRRLSVSAAEAEGVCEAVRFGQLCGRAAPQGGCARGALGRAGRNSCESHTPPGLQIKRARPHARRAGGPGAQPAAALGSTGAHGTRAPWEPGPALPCVHPHESSSAAHCRPWPVRSSGCSGRCREHTRRRGGPGRRQPATTHAGKSEAGGVARQPGPRASRWAAEGCGGPGAAAPVAPAGAAAWKSRRPVECNPQGVRRCTPRARGGCCNGAAGPGAGTRAQSAP